MKSEQKYLERPGVLSCVINTVIGILGVSLLLWAARAFGHMGELGATEIFVAVSFGMMLSDGFISRKRDIGVWDAVSAALGMTVAFVIFFSHTLQVFFVMWLASGVAFFLSGLVRTARLKREGYIERPNVASE